MQERGKEGRRDGKREGRKELGREDNDRINTDHECRGQKMEQTEAAGRAAAEAIRGTDEANAETIDRRRERDTRISGMRRTGTHRDEDLQRPR